MRSMCFALTLCLLGFSLTSPAQNATQVGQLTAPDLQYQSYFGRSAISAGTIAVSAPSNDYGYGALYVYEKPSAGWSTMGPTAMIYDGACNLGVPLAISSDGTVVASSNGGCYGGLGTSGASIAILVKPSTGWQLQSVPTAIAGNKGGSGYCGYDFAMSSDGKTLVCSDSLPWVHKNYLYLIDEPAGGWTGTVFPTSSIQLSYRPTNPAIFSNTIALAGSPSGVLEVYQRTSGGIKLAATLTASDGERLCCEVAMNGQTIAVSGSPVSGSSSGKVYLFSKPSTGWANATETAQFSIPSLPNNAGFGSTIALGGKSLLVGGTYTLAAYLFIEPSGGWQSSTQPNQTIVSNDPNQVAFGDAVSLLGNTIVVGDWMEGANYNQNGAAYVYQLK